MLSEKLPSTTDEFYFWTDPDTILNPFDVVVADHVCGSRTYGVVEEISHITDSDSFLASFISNDFGQLDSPSNTDRIGLNYVKVHVVGNSKNIYIPVHNGSKVSLGSKEDILIALGLDQMKNPIVCGFLEMYSELENERIDIPVFVNSDFLIGPEGVHLNISGISGLASKTSYAMFLLNALQQQCMKEDTGKSVAYILMNVKGRDLLTIDQTTNSLSEDDKKMYQAMGLDIKPFQNVHYFYPPDKSSEACSYIRKDVFKQQMKQKQAKKYKYTFADDSESIALLFSNVDDPSQTMESIVNLIASKEKPFDNIPDWVRMIDVITSMTEKGKAENRDISVLSWRKFSRIIRKSIENNAMFSSEVNAEKSEIRLESAIQKIKKNERKF